MKYYIWSFFFFYIYNRYTLLWLFKKKKKKTKKKTKKKKKKPWLIKNNKYPCVQTTFDALLFTSVVSSMARFDHGPYDK